MNIARIAGLAALASAASLISLPVAGADDVQDNSSAKAEAAPAATPPSLLDRAKSWFSPGSSDSSGSKGDAATPPPQSDAIAVKNIDTVSAVSAQQFDPTCHTLVQPFGTTDSVLSLTKLMVELKTEDVVHSGNFGSLSPDAKKKMRMAATNLNWLPAEAERMLGQTMFDRRREAIVDPEEDKESANAVAMANSMLASAVAQIDTPTPYAFSIHVRQSHGNAQALPGGIIYIDFDLVTDKKLSGKAKFALAHELSHVLQRHETHATQARLTDGIDSATDMIQMLRGSVDKSANLIPYANRVMERFVKYSEDQELQADACAVRILDSAVKDKKQLAQIIREFIASLGKPLPAERAEKASEMEVFANNMNAMGKLGDQHPNTQARAENLERMLKEVSKTLPPEKPNQKVKVKK